MEFDALTIEQCSTNCEKWGHQDLKTLMLVLMEEVGEISRAMLEGEPPERVRAEIVDTSSVLRRLYMQAEET